MYRDGQAPGRPHHSSAVKWFAEGLSRGDTRSAVTAALLIGRERPAGYDLFNAAVFAATSATLRGNRYTREAEELLDFLSESDLNGATQKLINELSGSVAVDGAFGPSSQTALEELLDAHGAGPGATTPLERLLQLARLFRKTNPTPSRPFLM